MAPARVRFMSKARPCQSPPSYSSCGQGMEVNQRTDVGHVRVKTVYLELTNKMQKLGVAPSGNFREAVRRALARASPSLSSVAIAEAKYAEDLTLSPGASFTRSGDPVSKKRNVHYGSGRKGVNMNESETRHNPTRS